MGKIFHIIDSFSTGQLSPKLRGRTDLSQYNNGVKTLTNFTIFPQGGATRRTGTKFITEVKDESTEVRLLPFQFSTVDTYILEWGNLYLRFYRNQGQILDTTEFLNGDFATDLTDWTDNSSGTGSTSWNSGVADLVGTGGGNEARLYQSLPLGTNTYTITITTSAAVTFNIGITAGGTEVATGSVNGTSQTFSFTPTVATTIFIEFENANSDTRTIDDISIDNPAFQIETPYTIAQVKELQVAQSADILFITHPDFKPRKLSRFNHDNWTLTSTFLIDGPYFDITEATYGGLGADFTLTPSATTGTITLTAASDLFVSTDVGRSIRFRDNDTGAWGWCEITVFTSATVVTAVVQRDLTGTVASKEWRLGAFSGTTGYPKAITFHDQRLYFASTTKQPQTFWGSTAGLIEDFQPDNSDFEDAVDPDTSVTFTVASTQANIINWLSGRRDLFLGTTGNIFVATGDTITSAITPDDISVKNAVGIDVKDIQPIVSQNATLFVQFFTKKLMELTFFFEEDGYRATDLTILSDNITSSGIKAISFQEVPDNIIWCVTTDGKLIGLTYLRTHKIVGWHNHIIGGTGVEVETIAVIPGATQSELWMVVKRTIDGATKRYVEVLTETFDGTKSDMWFLDSALPFTSTDSATITGISKANPGVVTTSSSHGFSNDDTIKITSVAGMTEVNDFNYIIKNVTSTTFELLNTDTSNFTTYTSSGTALKLPTSVTGLDHLEGETLGALVNESPHPDVVVSSGTVNLNHGAESALFGLNYTSILETNALESKVGLGTLQGSIGRTYKSILRFFETLGGQFGHDLTTLDPIQFRSGSDAMDSSPDIFSGDKILESIHGNETEQVILIQQDQPLPMTILSIISKMVVSDA